VAADVVVVDPSPFPSPEMVIGVGAVLLKW
jgi:hypothetical protein